MKIKYLCSSIFIILLAGIGVYGYIAFKATYSSFTHDESFSYLNYVHTSFMDIISFKNWYTNNHILNSLLMKYSEKLFGSSEISLRLPNLLLFAVYMIYSFFLFKKNNSLILVGLFLLLCTNNFIVDLFGLARGYGLSFGFMLMSLYHFIQFFFERQRIHIILFHAGALFAVLSSFLLFNFYLILLLIYNLIRFIEDTYLSHTKYNFLNSNTIHIIPFFVVSAILYEPIRRVIMYSRLDFGGKTGFYSDTVENLINYSMHMLSLSPAELIVAKIIFTSIVLIPFYILIRMIIKKSNDFFYAHKGLIITTLLLILMSLAITLQHIIFKVDYPISRFSLFILPLFIIHFGFFLIYFSAFYKKVIATVIIALALMSCLRFVYNANTRSCSEWGYDMETKNMIQKLSADYYQNNSKSDKIKIGIHWLFEPTINFYRQTWSLNWLLPVDRNGISATDNYYYIFKEELNQLSPINYALIYKFDGTNTVLLKNTISINIK